MIWCILVALNLMGMLVFLMCEHRYNGEVEMGIPLIFVIVLSPMFGMAFGLFGLLMLIVLRR